MIKWTPKAESDLENIFEHIAQNFTIDLALSATLEIVNFIESTLSENSLAGSILKSNPLFFKLLFKGNSIYYCENPKDKNIYIVYVQVRKSDYQPSRLIQVTSFEK